MPAVLRNLNMGEKKKLLSYRDAAGTAEQLAKKLYNFDMRQTLVRRNHQKLSRKQMYSGGWVSSMHYRHLNMGEKKLLKLPRRNRYR